MKMTNSKKGEMGIGTLIIFIALLLVAAIAAGVLIQTSGALQERALTTGDQAKSQISTNIRTIEVSATDGSNGTVTDFKQIVKLSAGSDAIKISQALFTFNSYDMTGSLTFRGTSGTCTHDAVNGYYTLGPNDVDIDLTTSVVYNFSDDFNDDATLDTLELVTIPADGNTVAIVSISNVGAYNITMNGVNCSQPYKVVINGTNYTADSSNDYVSYIEMNGACYNNTIPKETIFKVYPVNIGAGYFTIHYMQRGSNPVDGNLQRGDVIELCYESPRAIGEDETIRLNFIPKIGTPTLTQFITPEVMSTERVYLYP